MGSGVPQQVEEQQQPQEEKSVTQRRAAAGSAVKDSEVIYEALGHTGLLMCLEVGANGFMVVDPAQAFATILFDGLAKASRGGTEMSCENKECQKQQEGTVEVETIEGHGSNSTWHQHWLVCNYEREGAR